MLENLQKPNTLFISYERLNDALLFLDYNDNLQGYTETLISADLAYRHQGNFIAVMEAIGIDPSLYMYTMYLNGIYNPTDFDGSIKKIKIPTQPPIPRQ